MEEMSVVQLELSQSRLKARELTESNSSLEQSLEETKCQFSSENDQLNKKLTDTLQQLTLAEVCQTVATITECVCSLTLWYCIGGELLHERFSL